MTKYRKAMNIPSSRQRRDWTADEPGTAAASAPPAAIESNGHGPLPHHDSEDDESDEEEPHHADLITGASRTDGDHLDGSASQADGHGDGHFDGTAVCRIVVVWHWQAKSASAGERVDNAPPTVCQRGGLI